MAKPCSPSNRRLQKKTKKGVVFLTAPLRKTPKPSTAILILKNKIFSRNWSWLENQTKVAPFEAKGGRAPPWERL